MPFTKHVIEPINISQCPLPPGEPNELECLSNLTLANVVRQLSSLAQHAGRIFTELSQDATKVSTRTQTLHQRIENLKTKCSQLDIQNEEVCLADFQAKKQFKSSVRIDQQVVSRKTMTDAMRIMYNNADPPPALDKLNPYRTDGKDCMKFYTDPEFFFNIWCNELIKDNETRKLEKKRRRTKNDKQPNSKPSQPLMHSHHQIPLDLNINIPHGIFPHHLNLPQHHQHIQQSVQQEDIYGQQKQLILLKQQHQQTNNAPSNLISTQYLHHQQIHHHQQQQQMPFNQITKDMNENPMSAQQNIHPTSINQSPHISMNFEIYAETNKQNGSRNSRGPVIPVKPSNERPMLPPPPIPNNPVNDLQQIQQQMMRKKIISDMPSINSLPKINEQINDVINNDLPPPPSPPTFINDIVNLPYSKQNFISNNTTSGLMSKLNINNVVNLDSTDNGFDIPLPPPPVELQVDFNHHNHHIHRLNQLNHGQIASPLPSPPSPGKQMTQSVINTLPPPPPLPPLAESDSASTSSSVSISKTHNLITGVNNNSDESKNERGCFLEDINKRRFQLKSTHKQIDNGNDGPKVKENLNSRDTIQPLVNNSDVAAIIDFIRKFRPHVRDSSDDDEENSDWDE